MHLDKLITPLTCFIFCTATFQAAAFDVGIITGTVTEKVTGDALIGVNIQIEGTLLGAASGTDGNFIIKNVPLGTYMLRASMIGFRIVHIPNVSVSSNKTVSIAIQLEKTVINFDPLIVTSSKKQQELDATANSVSVMSAPEIRSRNTLRVDQALEAISGVNFIREQVNIRGSTGFTIGAANRTLLLVDGVPVMTSDTGEFNWDLLPVLDIDQIEVVKGAGSALWGTAALGGVINIITKSPSD